MGQSPLEVLAVFLMFGLTVTIHYVWAGAFLNGGSITVTVDTFGEMWIEYVLWIVLGAVVSVGFTEYLNDTA